MAVRLIFFEGGRCKVHCANTAVEKILGAPCVQQCADGVGVVNRAVLVLGLGEWIDDAARGVLVLQGETDHALHAIKVRRRRHLQRLPGPSSKMVGDCGIGGDCGRDEPSAHKVGRHERHKGD